MECPVDKKSHFRHILLFTFNRGQKATEAAREICSVYGEDAIAVRTAQDWFAKFENGNFDLNDDSRSGRPTEIDEDQLRGLLKEDGHQTCEELAEKMNSGHSTVSRHLQTMEFTQKLGAWVPHELSEKQKEKRVCIAAQNLARHQGTHSHKQRFLYRIITGDEKWCLYANLKQRKEWIMCCCILCQNQDSQMSAMQKEKLATIEADEDIFEINDFTVVTELEIFIVAIETALHDNNWLADSNQSDANEAQREKPNTVSQTISYKSIDLELTYQKCVDEDSAETFDQMSLTHLSRSAQSLLSVTNDFAEETTIAKQFGVYEYLLLTASNPNKLIKDQDYVDMLLSALNVATVSTECQLPIFVQIGDPINDLYAGVAQNRNARTCFEGAYLKSFMFKHKYLDGLIDIFREKVDTPLNLDRAIHVSVELNYTYQKGSPTPSETAACDDKEGEKTKLSCTHQYPFGADLDPLKELNLSVCWVNVKESVLTENENYSDLEPSSTPKWFASATFHNDSKYQLSATLTEILDCRDGPCSSCILKSFGGQAHTSTDSAANVLSPLTQNYSSSQLNFVASKGKPREEISGCIENLQQFFSLNQDEKQDMCQEAKLLIEENLKFCKAAPPNSLASQITKCLICCLIRDANDLSSMSNLWEEFVQMLRDCWENNTNLPGFSDDDQLDLSKCLFHQKLQILQFCIATKRKRHSYLDEKHADKGNLKNLAASTSQMNLVRSDEEFYDASDSLEAETPTDATKEPRGRLHLMDPPENLVDYADRKIYVPITQDRGPMSEDMIDALTNYLTSLKDGDARTRAQLDILLSDMQAFKAANPGSILADFVRWHSPRDWIETQTNDGLKKGELSDRMQLEGNVWQELWESARPIPVILQARLFNETKEVERILQSFNSILVIDLIHLILPIVVADATIFLINNSAVCLTLVKSKLIELCQKVVKFTKRNTVDDVYDIRKDMEHIETTVARYFSLNALFEKQISGGKDDWEILPASTTQVQSLILEILDNKNSRKQSTRTERVRINDAPRGPLANTVLRCICLPFDSTGAVLPKPSSKQYILRWITPRPGVDSRLMTQRMFALVDEEKQEFRLCGSFTSDLAFA